MTSFICYKIIKYPLILSLFCLLIACDADVNKIRADLEEQFEADVSREVERRLGARHPSPDISKYCVLEEYAQGIMTTCIDGRILVCTPSENSVTYFTCQMVGK